MFLPAHSAQRACEHPKESLPQMRRSWSTQKPVAWQLLQIRKNKIQNPGKPQPVLLWPCILFWNFVRKFLCSQRFCSLQTQCLWNSKETVRILIWFVSVATYTNMVTLRGTRFRIYILIIKCLKWTSMKNTKLVDVFCHINLHNNFSFQHCEIGVQTKMCFFRHVFLYSTNLLSQLLTSSWVLPSAALLQNEAFKGRVEESCPRIVLYIAGATERT